MPSSTEPSSDALQQSRPRVCLEKLRERSTVRVSQQDRDAPLKDIVLEHALSKT